MTCRSSSLHVFWISLLLHLWPANCTWSLTQYNATLVLSAQPLAMGQYLSGDWWLQGPITILSTEPIAAAGRNGFEISPKSIYKQPYDSRAVGYDAAAMPQLPLTVNPGDNIVKMVSVDSWPGGNPTYIMSAMIVTIVSSPPPAQSYRPAYFRNNSAVAALQFTGAQVDWNAYPSLPLPPAPACPPAPYAMCTPMPPINTSVTIPYSMPQIDHMNGWSGAQIHPIVNMPNCHYGQAIPMAAGLAAARLLLNDVDSVAKAAASHGLVQYGIDIGGIVAGGGNWQSNGGWENGRKLILGLATLVLGESNLTALTAGVGINPDITFSEDNEIWVSPNATSPGSILWGTNKQYSINPEVEYWHLVVSGNGNRIIADPYGFIDGGAVPGGYYDFCCVYKPWKGEALPQHMSPKLAAIINSSEMLTFVTRRYEFGTWTLPDPCAPPTGECSDASGRCAGWLGSPCGTSGKGTCTLDLKDYGVLFGPNNATPGMCITGKGRFPDLHGKNKDGGEGDVLFVDRLYAEFIKNDSEVIGGSDAIATTTTTFRLPPWPSTYNMSLSTCVMPAWNEGIGPVPYPPEELSRWGLCSIDWSNGWSWWSSHSPQDCEETLSSQAEAVHALNPAQHTWVYSQYSKALPWMTSVREKLEDRNYERWFIPKPTCLAYDCGDNATANLWHDESQTPNATGDCGNGVECGQYLFDLRNASLREWMASSEYLGTNRSLGNPSITGFYFDDPWYPTGPGDMPVIPNTTVQLLNFSAQDVKDMLAASALSVEMIHNYTIASGGFAWQMFNTQPEYPNTVTNAQPNCAPFLRKYCGQASQTQISALHLQFSLQSPANPWPLPYPAQDVAQFLLVRGPYAWLGYGWESDRKPNTYELPPQATIDYGEPLNFCTETALNSGIFTREYTKFTIEMDCGAFQATFTPKTPSAASLS